MPGWFVPTGPPWARRARGSAAPRASPTGAAGILLLAGRPRGGHWNRYASHHVVALLHDVAGLRGIRVETGCMEKIETRTPLGIEGGVGPGRQAVGAHAPGVCPQGGHRRLHQCLWT